MLQRTLILLLLLSFATVACFADIIHLKSGRQIKAQEAKIVGDKVVFRVLNGEMSVALSAVAKIEKTKGYADTRSSFSPAISRGSGAQPVSSQQELTSSSGKVRITLSDADFLTGGKKLDFMLDESPDNPHATAYNTIAAMKLIFEKSRIEGNKELSRLQNMVYTKTSLGSSTAAEKQRIQYIQGELANIDSQLARFEPGCREAGLSEDEIATIKSLRHESYSLDDLARYVGKGIAGTMMELMKDSMKEFSQEMTNQMRESFEGMKITPAERK